MNPRRHSQLRPRQSRSFAERSRRRAWVGIIAVCVIIVLLPFVLSRLSSLPVFAIDTIEVYGADPSIIPAIQAGALGAVQGSYIDMFSKSNVFLYPRSQVALTVASSSPRIATVSVSRDGWNALVISVSEKPPAAVVCADLPDFDASGHIDSSTDTSCYFADQTGLLFEPAPAASPASSDPAEPAAAPGSYERYYAPDLSAGDDAASPLGSYATSTPEFVALQSFLHSVRAAGIVPEGILIKDGGEYELYVDNPSSASAADESGVAADPVTAATSSQADLAVIYFNDAGGLDDELADLTAFWTNAVTTAHSTGQPAAFESIDLRYGPNVFYRSEK